MIDCGLNECKRQKELMAKNIKLWRQSSLNVNPWSHYKPLHTAIFILERTIYHVGYVIKWDATGKILSTVYF